MAGDNEDSFGEDDFGWEEVEDDDEWEDEDDESSSEITYHSMSEDLWCHIFEAKTKWRRFPEDEEWYRNLFLPN